MIAVQVKCRHNYLGVRTPRWLTIQNLTLKVKRITDQWMGPGHHYFKVVAEDDATYILRHDVDMNVWEIVLYEKANAEAW